MKHFLFVLVCCCGLVQLLAICGSAQKQSSGISSTDCAVRFHVVDRFGTAIPYKISHFAKINRNDETDFTKQTQGLNVGRVPCGRYTYVLDRVDIQTRQGRESGELTLDSPHKWVTVVTDTTIAFTERGAELAVENVGYSGSSVTGRVVPNPVGAQASWVSLKAVYGTENTAAPLDRMGNFTLYSVPRGKHLLTVHHGNRVLAVFPVVVTSTRSQEFLTVALPSNPPSELVIR